MPAFCQSVVLFCFESILNYATSFLNLLCPWLMRPCRTKQASPLHMSLCAVWWTVSSYSWFVEIKTSSPHLLPALIPPLCTSCNLWFVSPQAMSAAVCFMIDGRCPRGSACSLPGSDLCSLLCSVLKWSICCHKPWGGCFNHCSPFGTSATFIDPYYI